MTAVALADLASPDRIAARALLALGRTREVVAAVLATAGFTGLTKSGDRCPVARYLLATDPRLSRVNVGIEIAHLILPDEALGIGIAVPEPVGAFISRFDAGYYPHLIASPQRDPLACPGTTAGTETAQ